MIERLRVRNHRGIDVPATLGLVLFAAGGVSTVAVAALSEGGVRSAGWIAAAGAALVAVAGLVDDLTPGGPRGIRGHLRSLAGGRVTSGIVKLVVIAGCAVAVVSVVPGRTGAGRAAGIVLVAAATNLWNGLDVRPARALKFAYPALALLGMVAWPLLPFAPGVALAALLLLPWDAGERAMLGDCGANLLGFTAGMCLLHTLEGQWLVGAAVVGVALNVVAETFTLSRAIDAVPPLRWYDRLGRAAGEG